MLYIMLLANCSVGINKDFFLQNELRNGDILFIFVFLGGFFRSEVSAVLFNALFLLDFIIYLRQALLFNFLRKNSYI